MTKMMKFVGLLLLVAISCSAVFVSTKEHYSNEVQVVEKETLVEVEKKMSGEIIQEKLRDTGEFVSKDYAYTEVEDFYDDKDIKGFKLPFSESGYLLSYEGTIKAGIDFTQIQVSMDEKNKTIEIGLPEAIIISSELDTTSFCLYNEKHSFYNPFSVEDVNNSITDLKERALNRALEKGLLEDASESAKDYLRSFVGGFVDLKEYSLVFYEEIAG